MADSHTPKKDQWSSETYASAAGFVPKLTQAVLAYLDPQPTDRILDVGCGDGKFTANFIGKCSEVYGVDASETFIKEATEMYATSSDTTDDRNNNNNSSSKVSFAVVDCRFLESDSDAIKGNWDKVVSNAAMHWILRDPSTRLNTLKAILSSLKPGGKFVFEQGGAGCVAEVQAACLSALVHLAGYTWAEARDAFPWFFADPAWMTAALKDIGFEVEVMELVYRPTKLEPVTAGREGTSAVGGIEGWIRLMLGSVFDNVEQKRGSGVKEQVIRAIWDTPGYEA